MIVTHLRDGLDFGSPINCGYAKAATLAWLGITHPSDYKVMAEGYVVPDTTNLRVGFYQIVRA